MGGGRKPGKCVEALSLPSGADEGWKETQTSTENHQKKGKAGTLRRGQACRMELGPGEDGFSSDLPSTGSIAF